MSDFGKTFKTARESRGVTIDRIAAETRIAGRFLEAIENEDFQALPSGVFRRGFIRSYAEVLGMDIEKTLAEYERISNYREPVVLEGLRVSAPPADKKNLPLFYPIAIGALLVLIAIVYFVTSRDTAVLVTTSPPAPAVVTPAPQQQPVTAEPEPVAPAAPTPAAPTPEPPTNALAMVVEAREATWISIVTDGAAVPGELLQPGTTRQFKAQTSIRLNIGNAGGVSIKINDRELRPLGKSGQVRTITITPQNLNDLIG